MTLRFALTALVTVALAAAVTSGCTSPSSGSQSGQTAPDGSVVETATGGTQSAESSDAATGEGAAGGSGSSAKPDPGVDAQLDAMQKELDSLAMPGDTDFDTAAGSVY